MAQTYADNIANLRGRLSELQAQDTDSFLGNAQAQEDAFNEKTKGYSEKWQSVEQAGGEDIAGMLGAQGVYSGYKKIKKLYDGVQARKQATNQVDDDVVDNTAPKNQPSAAQGLDEPDLTPSITPSGGQALARPTEPTIQRNTDENPLLDNAKDDFDINPSGLGETANFKSLTGTEQDGGLVEKLSNSLSKTGNEISSKFQDVKNFFKSSGSGEISGTGEALEGISTTEAALAVGGLVAIGDGIYHLFHHPKQPTTATPNAPLQVTQNMTAKYSLALPSSDVATDRQASVGSF